MALLTKNDILGKDDRLTQIIKVPEWGGEVKIATMSGYARDRFESSVLDKTGKVETVNIRAKMVAASIIDEKGNLMFTEADVVQLGKKSCVALDRIFAAAQQLNNFGEQELEELSKN